MLILLPIAFLLLTCLHLTGSGQGTSIAPGDWRRGFLLAIVIFGVIVAVSAEFLSLFTALNRIGMTIVWGAAVLAILWFLRRRGTAREGLRRWQVSFKTLDTFERSIVYAMAALALVLLLVGWVSPPNNVDSHIYHMSKVVHWAQNQSLRHYAAINHAQLIRPPWTELAILHLRTLFGSDHPANSVQWFSMVGSVIGVSAITGLLGGSKRAQLLAAAAAFSVPMGILQSTSTQNDYAAGLWSVVLAYLVLLSKTRPLDRLESASLACTVGLGVFTKGTFFVYATPLLAWLFLPLLARLQFKRAIGFGAAMTVATLVINAGFWMRNISTYGGPYGPTDALQQSLGIIDRLIPGLNTPADSDEDAPPRIATDTPIPRGSGGESKLAPTSAWPKSSPATSRDGSVAASPPHKSAVESVLDAIATDIRMAAWNLVTPSSAINALIRRGMELTPSLFDEGYLWLIQRLAWNHEDTAGNPIQLILFLLSAVILAVTSKGRDPLVPQYAATVAIAYLLLPFIATAGAGPFGIRYQLPFFVLAGPAIAIAAARIGIRGLTELLAGMLLLTVVPYLLFNNTRPIIGRTPWPTRIGSIFQVSGAEVLLAMSPEAKSAYIQATDEINALACKNVGLRINSNDLEYALWWLLDAPQSGARLEVLYPLSSLDGYVDREFVPCAMICSLCGDERMSLNGLELVSDYGHFKVYAGSDFSWNQDD